MANPFLPAIGNLLEKCFLTALATAALTMLLASLAWARVPETPASENGAERGAPVLLVRHYDEDAAVTDSGA